MKFTCVVGEVHCEPLSLLCMHVIGIPFFAQPIGGFKLNCASDYSLQMVHIIDFYTAHRMFYVAVIAE
jgi:hypothetical protein